MSLLALSQGLQYKMKQSNNWEIAIMTTPLIYRGQMLRYR
jgi:hypothetical protein